MKRIFFLLLITFNLLSMGLAHAEKADAEKATNIEADKMVYDDAKQVNTFSGNVILTRGSLSLKAGKVVVTQDPAGYQFATLTAAPGSVATFRQKRDGGANLWVEGQAERIEYDGKSEMVKLFNNAKIKRLEGIKITDEVAGAFISYDSRSEFFTVNNSTSSDGKPGSDRISATIQPRIESKGK